VKKSFSLLVWVAAFAVAMAWLESATVYYLRTLMHRVIPYQANPLPFVGGFGRVELVREFATIFMLAALGRLAGNSARARCGYFLVGFGVWDIFYYVFLRVICGWPASIWDWDVLFLIPLPWWGPVLAPCLIASLMIVYGGWLASSPRPVHSPPWAIVLSLAGALGALLIFMRDALGVAGRENADILIRHILPKDFPWSGFLFCCALMAAPLAETLLNGWRRGRANSRALESGIGEETSEPGQTC
jgi:hypothetical protein